MSAIAEPLVLPQQKTTFYRPELDGLRFIAFFAVFVRHTTSSDPNDYPRLGHLLASISVSGQFGVDLFFLLSSYLITELLLREKADTGTLNIKSFYVRRILRIWPLYFLFLGVTYAFQFIDPSHPLPLIDLLAFLLLSGNWIYIFHGVPASIGVQLWSISIEEQFYLLWPQALKRIGRRGILVTAGILILVALSSRFCYHLAGYRTIDIYWYSTFSRLDPMAFGMLLAVFLKGKVPNFATVSRVALVAGGLVLWIPNVAIAQAGTSLLASTFSYFFASIGAVLFFLASMGTTGVLASKPFTYLGRVSYGLYVYHILAIVLVGRLFGHVPNTVPAFLAYTTTEFGLTLAMASLSYAKFEAHFLRLKERFAVVRSRPV